MRFRLSVDQVPPESAQSRYALLQQILKMGSGQVRSSNDQGMDK